MHASDISRDRYWLRPWCGGAQRHVKPSPGRGRGLGTGDESNFHLATPPPPEPTKWTPEWMPAATISGHFKRGLADGEQWLARRPIRTGLESTARCASRASQRAVTTTEGGSIPGQLFARVTRTVQTRNCVLGNWGN